MRARTIAIDPADVDLLALAGDDGFLWLHEDGGIAARGIAMDLRAGAAAGALAAIDVDDQVGRPGTGAIALGALPFTGASDGHLVVPGVVWGVDVDGAWMTMLGDGAEYAAWQRRSAPERFTLRSPRTHDDFRALVRAATDEIEHGELGKVVVAREVIVEADRKISAAAVAERLHALYPSCFTFSMGNFVGASPELLVERRGDLVRSWPLAGTAPHSGDPHADERTAARMLSSTKELNEHRFVVEQVASVLAGACASLDVPAGPSVVPFRNVMHLGTELRGRASATTPSALELALALHPTPAVGGTPTDVALAWLARHEHLARGCYAGPVGWVDADGNGSWAVAIRSAELRGATARLFAGVGIVAGSDPDAELAETQLKLQALLAALVRP